METDKEKIREAFRKKLNEGDFETAAKIAVYGALSNPWSAERFAEGLFNAAASHVKGFCVICGAVPGAGPRACPNCETARGANERMADMVFEKALSKGVEM